MTNPRFRPNEFAIRPELFGLVEDIQWRTTKPSDEIEFDASVLQHQISWHVRELMARRMIRTTKALATEIGVKPDRLQRLLAGHVLMRLEDIARFRLAFGIEFDRSMVRKRGTVPSPRLPLPAQGKRSGR
ncbi:hypothetical protein [Agromyces sp. Leaf222]|uniref:hypothetical protein n=1 Tax=Agromyces sp. Leaf222 TaxID=1735688 RepID=UPI0007019A5A|nr:hypothetical protein [Agromyces sp. Leaf222]KQM82409.1 hypothetical protein ASE68_03175 [Agromyces sp. Leaf222]